MICENCGEDYSDSNDEKASGTNRTTIGPLPHYGDKFQISGKVCRKCGWVAEMIKQPTGNPFYVKKEITDPKMLYSNFDYWTFLTENNLLKEFQEFVINKKLKKVG